MLPTVPFTATTECAEPWDSVTCFPVVTAAPLVSFKVTVIFDVSAPSAVADVWEVTTVDLVGEVDVAAGAEPSPGLSPLLVPSPGLTSNGAENRCGSAKPPNDGFTAKMPTTQGFGESPQEAVVS